MVNSEFAQIMSLHAGEAYAMQNLTKTDRLGLLISGKVSFIYSDGTHTMRKLNFITTVLIETI